ncbi:PQQ-binding-like beta-propeller repeat protein [Draconibacterium sp.]|nr:PQQ-binding-like beta-propeller repeat protein [Draconibacterium sp.]
MRLKIFFTSIILSVLFFGCVQKSNWNQYLGPDRNNTISGVEILREWPENGPGKIWEKKLGPGYGGASVFENEVFILDREKGESDILRCLDLETGEEKWNFEYEAKGEIPYPGSRTVPSIDKDFVWSVGPHGHFYCLDKKTQKPVWSHDLMKEFDAKRPNWGFSQSPIIYNDLVIVAPQGAKAGVAAFNKTTGDLVWKSRSLTGHNFHVSPIIANYGSVDQVIMISPYDRRDSTKIHEVVAFDVKSGEELWVYDGLKSFATIAPPTVIDDTRLFLTDCSYNGNYNPVSIMIEITKKGEDFKVKELFLTEEAGCKMHPGIVVNDHIYLNNNGRPNELVCLTMDGKRAWEKESAPNFEMGSIIKVGDLLIVQNGKNGDIHLIEPLSGGYKELGKASFFNSTKSQAWGPMAFSEGKLLVRDMEKIVCVNLQ